MWGWECLGQFSWGSYYHLKGHHDNGMYHCAVVRAVSVLWTPVIVSINVCDAVTTCYTPESVQSAVPKIKLKEMQQRDPLDGLNPIYNFWFGYEEGKDQDHFWGSWLLLQPHHHHHLNKDLPVLGYTHDTQIPVGCPNKLHSDCLILTFLALKGSLCSMQDFLGGNNGSSRLCLTYFTHLLHKCSLQPVARCMPIENNV